MLTNKLFQFCELDLQLRTTNKPQPPADWIMEVPKTNDYYQDRWNILKDFLESPTKSVFDYVAVQAKRKFLEEALRNVKIDLKIETIKKGSPHTLRITKTQGTYKKLLKQWEEDLELLKRIKRKIEL